MDPALVGTNISGVPVLDLGELETFVAERRPRTWRCSPFPSPWPRALRTA